MNSLIQDDPRIPDIHKNSAQAEELLARYGIQQSANVRQTKGTMSLQRITTVVGKELIVQQSRY